MLGSDKLPEIKQPTLIIDVDSKTTKPLVMNIHLLRLVWSMSRHKVKYAQAVAICLPLAPLEAKMLAIAVLELMEQQQTK